MIATLLVVALLQQGKPPVIDASADRTRMAVGEECVFTVSVTAFDDRPVQVTVTPPTGLAIVARNERTEPSTDGSVTVTTTLELRLRALEPGRWPIGPVRAVQGAHVVDADAVEITVTAAPDLAQSVLNPRLRRLLERMPPPRRPGDVALKLIMSSDTARVGEQVDVLAAAWFPRELRLQLRRPPVLQPPVIGGVWSQAQPSPGGLATSRQVGGEWYDLFIAHQTIFPLAPGPVTVPAAALRYSVPVALQFLSQEEPHELRDGPLKLVVLPLPHGGRPANFSGAVGRGLRLARTATPSVARAGEAVSVEITLAGEGNATLWPAPDLAWPPDARAYADNTDDHLTLTDGRIGGEKTFRYVVVPSRAGALALPGVRYTYFDPIANRFEQVTLAAGALPVRTGEAPSAERGALPVLPPQGEPWPRRVVGLLPGWLWLLLLAAAPLALRIRLPRRQRTARRAPAEDGPTRFMRALDALGANQPTDAAMLARLRAAGLADEASRRVTDMRRALERARYGPGAAGVAPSLARESGELAEQLRALRRHRRVGRRAVEVGGAVLLAVAAASGVRAQSATAEALYRSNAFPQAAEAFLRRVRAAPGDPALWYDLGAARLRAGDEAGAASAFTRARRLAPRSMLIANEARRLPAPDLATNRARFVSFVTPEELGLIGALVWLASWGATLVVRRRRRRLALLGAVVGAMLLAAAAGVAWWYARPVALARDTVTLRRAPHGRGDPVGDVPRGSVLTLGPLRGGWQLVAGRGGLAGWIPADAAVPLRE